MKCKNCATSFDANYCPNCGQSASISRVNFSNIITELSDNFFQINRGLFYTIKVLTIKPGRSIQSYLSGNRKQYYKPISYAIILSTIYFFCAVLIDTDTIVTGALKGFVDAGKDDELKLGFLYSSIEWLSNNVAYATLVLIPFFSISSYIIFIDKGFNFLEHIVLNSFISGQQALFNSLFLLISLVIDEDIVQILLLIFSIIYNSWAFIRFFKLRKWYTMVARLAGYYILNYLIITIVLAAIATCVLVYRRLH